MRVVRHCLVCSHKASLAMCHSASARRQQVLCCNRSEGQLARYEGYPLQTTAVHTNSRRPDLGCIDRSVCTILQAINCIPDSEPAGGRSCRCKLPELQFDSRGCVKQPHQTTTAPNTAHSSTGCRCIESLGVTHNAYQVMSNMF